MEVEYLRSVINTPIDTNHDSKEKSVENSPVVSTESHTGGRTFEEDIDGKSALEKYVSKEDILKKLVSSLGSLSASPQCFMK